eukprot:m.30102 g.30102  ORF g.30102 m.30102 type:complete len:540 (-) comp16216_c0_seq1:2617-4236(-)
MAARIINTLKTEIVENNEELSRFIDEVTVCRANMVAKLDELEALENQVHQLDWAIKTREDTKIAMQKSLHEWVQRPVACGYDWMLRLPDILIQRVLSFLPVRTLYGSAIRTCRRWHRLALSPSVQRLFKSEVRFAKYACAYQEPNVIHTHHVVIDIVLDEPTNRLFSAHSNRAIQAWTFENDEWKHIETLNSHTDKVYTLAVKSDPTTLREFRRRQTKNRTRHCQNVKNSWNCSSSSVDETPARLDSGLGSPSVTASPTRSRFNHHHTDGGQPPLDNIRVNLNSRLAQQHHLHTTTNNIDNNQHNQPHTESASDAVADEGLLFSGSSDNTICVWSLNGYSLVTTLVGHTSTVHDLVVVTDGRLFSASKDKTIRVWSSGTHRHVATLKGHTGCVHSLVTSSDGQKLFSGSSDTTVRVWSCSDYSHLHTIVGHTRTVMSLAISNDGRLFAGSSKSIRVWSCHDYSEIHTVEGIDDWVSSIVVTNTGRIFSGSIDKTVQIWSADNYSRIGTLTGHDDVVFSLALDSNDRLFSGSWDKTICVW